MPCPPVCIPTCLPVCKRFVHNRWFQSDLSRVGWADSDR